MNTTEKFSIIIPIYNSSKSIERCIESAISQDYQNFEILCVDDCSTDTTLKILDKYKKHDFVKIIHKEKNEGTLCARITGITEASSKYSVFCDSDDTLSPQLLKILNIHTQKGTFDIIEYGYHQIYNNTTITNIPMADSNNAKRIISLLSDHNVYSGMLWNKAFSTALLKKSITRINKIYSIRNDDDYLLLAIESFFPNYSNINDILYIQNIGDGVTSRTEKTFEEFKRIVNSILETNDCICALANNYLSQFSNYTNTYRNFWASLIFKEQYQEVREDEKYKAFIFYCSVIKFDNVSPEAFAYLYDLEQKTKIYNYYFNTSFFSIIYRFTKFCIKKLFSKMKIK